MTLLEKIGQELKLVELCQLTKITKSEFLMEFASCTIHVRDEKILVSEEGAMVTSLTVHCLAG